MTGTTVPTITLHDQTTIPQLGFGVFQVPPEDTAKITSQAFEVGYRHIDTAEMYQNEKGVGEAISSSGIPRDELFITSKLNNGFHEPDEARRAFDATLAALGLDQVDLFLIHWPLPTRYDGDFVSTWKTLEEFKADGNAVLFGSESYATGFDVPGDALRLVVVWKLPYPAVDPVSNAIRASSYPRYEDLMKVRAVQAIGRLIRRESDKGVVWLAINSTAADAGDYKAPGAMSQWMAGHKAAATATLMDADGKVGRAYGARTTPHMYIVDPKGTLVYAGGIDSIPSARADDIKTATNYVKQGLGEALAGKHISAASTKPYGCSVKYAG